MTAQTTNSTSTVIDDTPSNVERGVPYAGAETTSSDLMAGVMSSMVGMTHTPEFEYDDANFSALATDATETTSDLDETTQLNGLESTPENLNPFAAALGQAQSSATTSKTIEYSTSEVIGNKAPEAGDDGDPTASKPSETTVFNAAQARQLAEDTRALDETRVALAGLMAQAQSEIKLPPKNASSSTPAPTQKQENTTISAGRDFFNIQSTLTNAMASFTQEPTDPQSWAKTVAIAQKKRVAV